MSYALIDTNDLTTLGNAIRTKTGGSANLSISEMATAVAGISGGGGGWTPTSCSKINENYLTKGKGDVEVDMSNYKTGPFCIIVGYESNITTAMTLVYYNGSTYSIIYDAAPSYNPSSISGDILTAIDDEVASNYKRDSAYFWVIQ